MATDLKQSGSAGSRNRMRQMVDNVNKKPRGTKEEKDKRKTEARNKRVKNRSEKYLKKKEERGERIFEKYKEGKITKDLAIQKQMKTNSKKLDKARFIYGSKEDARLKAKKKKNK